MRTRPRIVQGIAVATILVTVIVVALTLAQHGIPETKRCALSIWQIQLPKWLGCIMAAHENLAGGLIGASGALFAGWLAWTTLREQIDLERASTEPEVIAYLLPDRRHINILHLVVANVGRGTARNVSFQIEGDVADFARRQIQIVPNTRRPILTAMPQGERVHLFFGSVFDILKDDQLQFADFNIHVRFDDMYGTSRENTCRASVVDLMGQSTVGIPPEYMAAESIKKIADEISHWSSGFKRLKVETITAEEESKRQKEAYNRSMELRAALPKPEKLQEKE